MLTDTLRKFDLNFRTVKVFPFIDRIIDLDIYNGEINSLPDIGPLDKDQIFIFGSTNKQKYKHLNLKSYIKKLDFLL